MRRRSLIIAAGAVLARPRHLFAQQSGRVYRIATLDDAVESARAASWQRFRGKLGELGLVEGRNVVYEARYARAAPERLPALAAELVSLRPDVIVTAATPASLAAKQATSNIPIVFIGISDPLGSGLVASLARPGGNVTGTTSLSTDTVGKLLELMRELAPGAKSIAWITDASNQASMRAFRTAEKAARAGGMTLDALDGRTRPELEKSFDVMRRRRPQGLIVASPGLLLEHRDRIVAFAASLKLPVVYARREYVDAGGLASYGWDAPQAYVRGADLVHRILTGARPGDLPVEQPTLLRLVINLRAARAQGIAIPATLRVRADELIE